MRSCLSLEIGIQHKKQNVTLVLMLYIDRKCHEKYGFGFCIFLG